IQSAGNRRIAGAVDLLAAALKESDPVLADAAATALGQIASREALAALESAPNARSSAAIEARLHIAHLVGGREASRLFTEIADLSPAPAELRAAGLLGLVSVEPVAAPERITRALASSDHTLKAVLIESLATHPADELVPAIARELPQWDPATRAAVIRALARRGDARARPAIVAAVDDGDLAVRTAALSALGQLPGDADVARLLAERAAQGDADTAKQARQSLARLNGPGVADAVIGGARAGDPALRAEFVAALASRYMIEQIPLLLSLRDDPDRDVRLAALSSLAEIAPFDVQAAVLAWATDAKDSGEQSRALRTLVALTLRNPDLDARARPITTAIGQLEPSIAARILPALPRLGGSAAAEALADLALRADAPLASPAVAQLSRWTDPAGLPALVRIVEKTSSDSVRESAGKAAAEFLERNRSLPSAQLTAAIDRLLAAVNTATVRAQLVTLLSRASDDEALALVKKFQKDPALAKEANYALAVIEANRAGAPKITGDNQWQLKNLIDGNRDASWNTSAEAGKGIQIDFLKSRPFRRVVLDQGSRPDNYPERLQIIVTDQPEHPGKPAAEVPGTSGQTAADLPPQTHGRYLIIRNSETRPDSWWTIAELLVD
ncbi:MAG TPA: HEAT repeat domain-containing protein, partial [Sphingomonadaceae bacterium]|nr:HEAT repeat domain-containing protein [Sphingomonadaceae bacterium]